MTPPPHKLTLVAATLAGLILMSASLARAESGPGQTVTDMAGRTVTIPGPVNRIVTTFKPASIMAYCLGLSRQITGMDNSSCRSPLLMAVLPETKERTPVGRKATGLNLETLVGLKPDLVILYSQKDGLEAARRLEALNIPALVIVPESFESIKTSLMLMARAAGRPDKGEQISRLMDEILDRVDQGLRGIARQKTGYFASPMGLFHTASGAMLQDRILNRAGVQNVAGSLKGYFQAVSPEQLIQWNPQVMVLSKHMPNTELPRLSTGHMAKISAISNRAVFRCPASLAPWDFPSPLSVLATLWLAGKTYPERFPGLDLLAEANQFHQRLFGKSLTQMGGTLNDDVDF